MARAVLMWRDGEHLKLADLHEQGAPTTIGRARGAGVDLSDSKKFDRYKAVSREHGAVRAKDGSFFLDHLSKTNPTTVNGTVVTSGRSHLLADRDVIDVGGLHITFYDLAAADRVSGVVCPSCGRENEPSRQDCWYDGTNLVNALTQPRRMRRANCRVVSAAGEVADLYSDEALTMQPSGQWKPQARGPGLDKTPASIELTDRQPVLTVRTKDLSVRINGEPAAELHVLSNGDEMRIGDTSFVVVVR